MDCSSPVSSVHEISQARLREWVAISFARASSQPRDQTCISFIGRQIFLKSGGTREDPRKSLDLMDFLLSPRAPCYLPGVTVQDSS